MRKIVLRVATILGLLLQFLPGGAALAYNGFGTTYVASVSAQNILNNNRAGDAAISRDGSRVVYGTFNDGTGSGKVYVKDLSTGVLTLASTRSDGSDPGEQSQSDGHVISDNGQFVAFTSYNLDLAHPGTGIFVHDMTTNVTRMVTIGFDGNGFNAGGAYGFSMSGDGRYITYASYASNMVSQSDADLCRASVGGMCNDNVFVLDTQLGTTVRITSHANGDPIGFFEEPAMQPRISQNGRYVIYRINSDILEWDSLTGETARVCMSDGVSICASNVSISADVTNDGSVFFAEAPYSSTNDYDGKFALMEWDLVAHSSHFVLDSVGLKIPTSYLSATQDGRYVTYNLQASGSTTVFIVDTGSGVIRLVSADSFGDPSASGGLSLPTITTDASRVAFAGNADDLVPGVSSQVTHVFIHDSADFAQPPTPIVDQTAPSLGALSWSANPLAKGSNTTLSVPVAETVSGVARVEYYAGSDPGLGNGTSMTLSGGVWTVIFGSGLAADTYNIGVRAEDGAGNWSDLAQDGLAVYDPLAGYVTGHADITPSAGDALPISARGDKDMTLTFTNVKYAGATTTQPSGSMDLSYVVKNNDDEFDLSSTSLDWLVVADATHVSIQGTADLTKYVNKATTVTSNPFRIDMVLGTGGAADHYLMKIYAPGANPATATALYVIDDDASASTVRIK